MQGLAVELVHGFEIGEASMDVAELGRRVVNILVVHCPDNRLHRSRLFAGFLPPQRLGTCQACPAPLAPNLHVPFHCLPG